MEKQSIDNIEYKDSDERVNVLTRTVLKHGMYLDPSSLSHKKKLTSSELLAYADKSWEAFRPKNYQKFLQLLSILVYRAKTKEDVVQVTKAKKSWENILGDRFDREWEYALLGAQKVHEKNLERLQDKFLDESVNEIEKWRLFPALMTTYKFIEETKDVTIKSALKVLEGALLPHYFKIPNDTVIQWISDNINQKKGNSEMSLPPVLMKQLENTRDEVFYI